MYGTNNYGYNPYGRYMPQQPIQQQMESSIINTQRPIASGLNGKVVESIDVVKAMDIPLDGSTSYFVIADGSSIVTKQLQMDGTSKMVVYKPVESDTNTTKYATMEDIKNSINEIDLSEIDDIKDDLKDIKKEIKDLKKKNKGD